MWILPRGVCNAILLTAVKEFNAKVAAACIAAIRKLYVDVNIPIGFAELGAKEEDSY